MARLHQPRHLTMHVLPLTSTSYTNRSNTSVVTTLMSSKRRASSPKHSPSKKSYSKNIISPRDGLGAYIANPEKFDSSRIIYYDDNFVAINDLYPKSSIHTLLLPRSAKHTLEHPFKAFEDPMFLASIQEQAEKLRRLVAGELKRRYGQFSKQEIARKAALNKDAEAEEAPAGRAWDAEVRAGIHAHPSMNHLHIHVMSVDRYSECLKHRKHYNSFATPFFVPIEDFPLAEDDVRRHPGREGYLDSDMKCWRCGKNFTNKFARLKEHLAEEFEEWKRE